MNLIPQKAIEKAIEGGWKDPITGSQVESAWEIIALDPTFWQALGKALGWGDPSYLRWKKYAEQFYDLILTSGDVEAYWNEILK